jgi:hypothetical protein
MSLSTPSLDSQYYAISIRLNSILSTAILSTQKFRSLAPLLCLVSLLIVLSTLLPLPIIMIVFTDCILRTLLFLPSLLPSLQLVTKPLAASFDAQFILPSDITFLPRSFLFPSLPQPMFRSASRSLPTTGLTAHAPFNPHSRNSSTTEVSFYAYTATQPRTTSKHSPSASLCFPVFHPIHQLNSTLSKVPSLHALVRNQNPSLSTRFDSPIPTLASSAAQSFSTH